MVRALARGQVDVTLIDRCNHHLFQPLLYQVAAAGLAAPAISAPMRHILRREMRRGRQTVLQAEVHGIDATGKHITLDDGTRMAFDHLVAAAAGAVNSWFGHDDWVVHAPGLKTLANAAADDSWNRPHGGCDAAGGDERRNAKLRLCRAPGLLGGNMSWQQRERGQAQERQDAQGQRMGAPTAVWVCPSRQPKSLRLEEQVCRAEHPQGSQEVHRCAGAQDAAHHLCRAQDPPTLSRPGRRL